MMRCLRAWTGLLMVAVAPLAVTQPALAQQTQSVEYGPLQDMPLGEFPLTLAVAGWESGFTHASRQTGRIGDSAPVITRYVGQFSHGGYFGRVVFLDSQREVRWRAPTPPDSIRDWPFFQNKPHAFGRTGAVSNGRMTLDYVHVKLDETEPKACALFTGAHERVQLRGYACAVQSGPFDAAEHLMRALGRPGLLEPVAATLPVIRAATGPGGQDIVAGAPFDARVMPFVPDATRAKLPTLYGNAPEPKALALHASGAVVYMVNQSTEKEAIRRALERCAFEARSPCVLYAVGNRVVFQHDAVTQDPLVSAAAPSATPRPSGGGTTPLTTAQLVTQLEKATVLIAATSRKGAAVGSGFFIAPDRLLTNRHVVDGADRVLVTSRALGRPYSAKVIAATDRGAAGSADYALLEVPGVKHEQLQLTTQIAKLQDVVAAGYPGITIGNDADFSAFAQGQRNAAPDLVLTRGEINAIQVNRAKVPTLAHTALISQGNSGGPLVDRCGRVVGINSYLISQTTVSGFAIASSDLIEFLGRHGIKAPVNNTPCG
jgi:S1-C subfamily serine protease